jgi:hypothetical protein
MIFFYGHAYALPSSESACTELCKNARVGYDEFYVHPERYWLLEA